MNDSPYVDVAFPLTTSEAVTIPVDHGYTLYSALSKVLPAVHRQGSQWAILPIKGLPVQGASLILFEGSKVRLRLPATDVAQALALAGKAIQLSHHKLRLGVPEVSLLEPAKEIVARFVTIAGFEEREGFIEALKRQVAALLPGDSPSFEVGRRRVITIKHYTIVGYTVGFARLSPEHSIHIQREGFGGRRKMGGGIFLPQPIHTLMEDHPHGAPTGSSSTEASGAER